MTELTGKTAFVTGGASGIGFALGRAFAEAGMKVMLADIETDALADAVKQLHEFAPNVQGVVCDVSDSASVTKAAAETFAAFGNVHVVCNNAGVAAFGGIEKISVDSWRWVFDVNVMGVVHGIHAFLPHLLAHGEGGHIVNTASTAGLQSNGGFSSYFASKHAVVAMSEGLAKDLAPRGIGVTVLCPSFVKTRINDSGRNRQEDRYGPTPTFDPKGPTAAMRIKLDQLSAAGIDASEFAARSLAAIRANDLYLFTHPGANSEMRERFAAIEAAMDKA
jgi:NAD(P)-dependent dehydrogenase (short-subunit alcohol dehydrogenase family)